MEPKQEVGLSIKQPHPGKKGKDRYSRLYRKFIFLILICSLVPLILVGWGIYAYYSGFSKIRIMGNFKNRVEYHRETIELFLRERTSDLQLVILTHSPDSLQNPENLRRIFSIMNHGKSFFTDLGLIDDEGNHLAYIGPYSLMDKNYSQAFWFKEVMNKGIYISDMFTGFRNAPHFIIAVTRIEGNRKWILRASVDTEYFRSLVENVKIGATGGVYLSNQEGILQTTPCFSGKIMEKAPLPVEFFSEESSVGIYEDDNKDPNRRFSRQLVAYTWLENPRWKLVVKQDYDEAFRDANRANRAALIFLHLSLLIILVISVISTRYMIKIIKKGDEETELLNKQLVQAGKLATLGTMAAGMAHEINQPLNVIQICADIILKMINKGISIRNEELVKMARDIIDNVTRAADVIKHVRDFSRQPGQSGRDLKKLMINDPIKDVFKVLGHQISVHSIQLSLELDPGIPEIRAEHNRLEQVFINLVTNAIDSMDENDEKKGGRAEKILRIKTYAKENQVVVEVSDTGLGMNEEVKQKIFEPFFTTKETGKGTGLGTSISFGIIKDYGGTIEIESEYGKGATFIIRFPAIA